MAEVVGLVSAGAGLLSLALQLGEAATKLKSFYERVRDMQSRLNDLAFDLETAALTLQELERHRLKYDHDTNLLVRCASRCEMKVKQVSRLVGRLERHIDKYRLAGRAYAALKQPEITSVVLELEQAMTAIFRTFQLYHFSVQSAQNDQHQAQLNAQRREQAARDAAMLHELRQLAAPPRMAAIRTTDAHIALSTAQEVTSCFSAGFVIDPEAAEENVQDVTSARRRARPDKQHQIIANMHLSFASWLTGRIWDIAAVRSQSALTLNLQQWNVIPGDSSIFGYCMSGKVCAVRDMIGTGKASMFDVDPFGQTLLDYSSKLCNIDLCRFLLVETVFPATSTTIGGVIARHASNVRWANVTSRPEVESMYRLLLDEFGDDVDVDEGCSTWDMTLNAEIVGVIQRNLGVPWESQTFQRRLETAMRHNFDKPRSLLKWIGSPGISYEMAAHTGVKGESFLHVVVQNLMASIERSDKATEVEEWAEIVSNLIKAGAEPSLPDSFGRSPLFLALDMLLNPWGSRGSSAVLEQALALVRIWINALKVAGVDLVAFARCEKLVWSTMRNMKVSEVEGLWPGLWPVQLIVDIPGDTVRFELMICEPHWLQRADVIPGSWSVPSAGPGFRLASGRPSENGDGDDEDEVSRRWRTVRVVWLNSKPFEATEELERRRANDERVRMLTGGSQDDNSPVFRIIMRGRRRPATLRRSVSQPPCTQQWNELYWRPHTVGFYGWLRFHLCPRDNQWREGCRENLGAMSLGACMRDRRRETDLFANIMWGHWGVRW